MNKEQREELKRLEAEATPGPWNQATNPGGPGDQPAFPSVRDSSGKPHGQDIIMQTFGDSPTCKTNSALVSAMRNALPDLLRDSEELERLRAVFAHTHVNNPEHVGDACAKCGLDLRDPINHRAKQEGREDG